MSLVITLSENTPETNLPAEIIDKLYNLTYSTSNGVTSLRQDRPTSLVGTIRLSSPTYLDYVTALTTQYPQFHVDASQYYLLFEDPVVQLICATKWGDGTGVTSSLLASVDASTINSSFKGNTSITKFNEFKYFTVATLTMSGTFKNCSSLEEITLPASSNRLNFGPDVFWGCTNLTKVNGLENVSQCYDNSVFRDCAIEEIIMPNCTFWARSSSDWNQIGSICYSCSSLKKISFQSITAFNNGYSSGSQWYESIISYCPNLEILDLGATCTKYGGTVFLGTFSNLKAIIFRGTTPPTCSVVANDNRMWGGSTAKIYVPASALNTYQTTAPFSSLHTAGRLDTIENAIANNIIDA